MTSAFACAGPSAAASAGLVDSLAPLASAGGGGSFSPTDIASLLGWWDLSDASTVWEDTAGTIAASNGGPVGRVDDKAGSANLTQVGAANRPTYRTAQRNGLNVCEGDGGDALFFKDVGNYHGPNVDWSMIGVFARLAGDGTSGNKTYFGPNQSSALFGRVSGNWRLYAGTGVDSGVAVDTNWHYVYAEGDYNGSTTAGTVRLDGSVIINGVTCGNAAFNEGFALCGGVDTKLPPLAYVGEVLAFNAILTAQEISDVEAYLVSKWGF